MPPSRATLNQPVNLNSANALYNHASSTGAVHGLPTGANVLGDKTGTGRFVQTQTANSGAAQTSGTPGFTYAQTFSHAVAYASTPIVVCGGGGSYAGDTLCAGFTCAWNVTTTTVLINIIGTHTQYINNNPQHWMTVGV